MSFSTKFTNITSIFAILLFYLSCKMRLCSSFSFTRSCEGQLISRSCRKINTKSISQYKIIRFTNYHIFTTKLYSSLSKDINTATCAYLNEITESPKFSDWEFRQIELVNGILVTLVRDGESEKSSCCLGVACGAKDDPPHLPGLAHFTEHAVFMGSHKYPIENAYKQFINQNGGRTNGGTGMEMTTFQFSIDSKAFPKALDIYSQFFKSPLFNSDSLSREIIAIDSEDSKNRILDGRRNLQLLKNLLSTKSNYEKFSTGNLKTLGILKCNKIPQCKMHGQAFSKDFFLYQIARRDLAGSTHTNDLVVLFDIGKNLLKTLGHAFYTMVYSLPTIQLTIIIYGRFIAGHVNQIESLKNDYVGHALKSNMLKFYTEHYQPKNMVLSLVGPQSLNELELYAKEFFSDIGKSPAFQMNGNDTSDLNTIVSNQPNSNIAIKKGLYTPIIPFCTAAATANNSNLKKDISEEYNSVNISIDNYPFKIKGGKIIKSRPISDVNEVSIIYSFPFTLRHLYRRNPFVLLSYLLSNKYKNSLYDILFNTKKLIFSLSAGIRESYIDFTLFEINVKLTEKGVEVYEEVISIINEYLRFIEEFFNSMDDYQSNTKTSDNLEYLNKLWYELYISSEIDFKFQDRSTGYELVQELVDNMMRYERKHVFSGGWLMDETFTSVDNIDMNIHKNNCTVDDASLVSAVLKNPVSNSSFLLLKNILSKYLIPESSMIFLRLTNHKNWIPTDLSDLDITDSKILELIKNNKVGELLNLRTKTNKGKDDSEIHNDIKINRIEPYYGIPYSIADVNVNTMDLWKNNRYTRSSSESIDSENIATVFQLPPLNPYICEELLTSHDNNLVIHKTKGIRLKNNDDTSSQLNNVSSIVAQIIHSTPPRLIAQHWSKSSISAAYTNNDFNVNQNLDFPQHSLNQLWYSRDELFYTPKSTIALFIFTPLLGDSHPINSMISTIYSQMTSYKYYPASIAGLDYSTNLNNRGLQLTVSGYTPKLKKLMLDLCQDWLDTTTMLLENSDTVWNTITDEYFDNLKKRSIQNIKSWYTGRPDSQSETILNYLLEENVKLPEEVLNLTARIEKDHVKKRLAVVKNMTKLIVYAHGELNETDVHGLYHEIQTKYFQGLNNDNTDHRTNMQKYDTVDISTPGVSTAEIINLSDHININEVPARARVLPSPSSPNSEIHNRVILPSFNPNDPNSALITYFQTERRSPRVSALQLVISRLFSEPLFSALRTTDQLGYIVSFSQANFGRYPDIQRGFLVKVLSKQFDPVYCEHRLNTFLLSHYDYINFKLTQENVTSIGSSIIQSLIEPPKSFLDEASLFYDAIINNKPWNMTEKVIVEIKKLSLKDVQEYCNTYIFNKYHTRKTISMMLFGGSSDNSNKFTTVNDNAETSIQDEIITQKQPGVKSFEHIMIEKEISYSKLLKHVYDIDISYENNEIGSSYGDNNKHTFVPLGNTNSISVASDTSNINSKNSSRQQSNLYIGMKGVSEFRNQLPFLDTEI